MLEKVNLFNLLVLVICFSVLILIVVLVSGFLVVLVIVLESVCVSIDGDVNSNVGVESDKFNVNWDSFIILIFEFV